ncbi:hypothetical protein BDF21DRAFT_417907 [Thamnidium elegans]|nr:hypothetical protein BDF21DRAFT_417907 [Thamnidium elegans]
MRKYTQKEKVCPCHKKKCTCIPPPLFLSPPTRTHPPKDRFRLHVDSSLLRGPTNPIGVNNHAIW